jgi:hypothetical protein
MKLHMLLYGNTKLKRVEYKLLRKMFGPMARKGTAV